jgi:hypothetical protein
LPGTPSFARDRVREAILKRKEAMSQEVNRYAFRAGYKATQGTLVAARTSRAHVDESSATPVDDESARRLPCA